MSMVDKKNRVSSMKLARAVETIQRGCAERRCDADECPLFDKRIRVCCLIATRSPQFYRVPHNPKDEEETE